MNLPGFVDPKTFNEKRFWGFPTANQTIMALFAICQPKTIAEQQLKPWRQKPLEDG